MNHVYKSRRKSVIMYHCNGRVALFCLKCCGFIDFVSHSFKCKIVNGTISCYYFHSPNLSKLYKNYITRCLLNSVCFLKICAQLRFFFSFEQHDMFIIHKRWQKFCVTFYLKWTCAKFL